MLASVPIGLNELYLVDWTPSELKQNTLFEASGMAFDPEGFGWAWFSDRFRLACIWRWGGTYTDTDNICIGRLPGERNLVSRTYDPHSFDIKGETLIPGKYREGTGKERYNHIPFRLRNDPFLNFDPEHPFLRMLVERKQSNVAHGKSWQALLGELFLEGLELGIHNVRAVLLLAYFPDGRGCYEYSDHDKCKYGGEICDILYRNCPDIKHVGNYQTRRRQYAQNILNDLYRSFPYCCFLWSKGHYGFRKGRENKISNWLVRLVLETVQRET